MLERALKDLHRRSFELRKLKNLSAKHVHAIIAEWRARGLESSTLSTNFSHLRCLCRWVDKPELLQVIREINEAEPSLTRRRVATDRDRSEQGAGIDRAEILGAALQIDPRFCCVLALMGEFSLRMLEALLFRPHLAQDPPGCIHILWGTECRPRPEGSRRARADPESASGPVRACGGGSSGHARIHPAHPRRARRNRDHRVLGLGSPRTPASQHVRIDVLVSDIGLSGMDGMD